MATAKQHDPLVFYTAKPYNPTVDIEFDPAKDAANIAKHGVTLIFGLGVLMDCVGTEQDERHPYGEVRTNASGFVNGRLHVCTFTMRGHIYRIISVRKSSRQEQRRWHT